MCSTFNCITHIKPIYELLVELMDIEGLSPILEHFPSMFMLCTVLYSVRVFQSEQSSHSVRVSCIHFNWTDQHLHLFGTEYDKKLCCSQEHLQKCSPIFLLGLKENFKLTQVALQDIIGVITLYQQNIIGLKAQVCVSMFDFFQNSVFLFIIGTQNPIPGFEECFSEHKNLFTFFKTHSLL